MIHEIAQFIDHLEHNNQEIFSENLELKEGFYAFVEKEDDNYVIDKNSILQVNDKTEKNDLYNAFLERYINSEMIKNKSMNSREKIFIDIGTPFGISISGKGLKPQNKPGKGIQTHEDRRAEQKNALKSYFKKINEFIDSEDKNTIDYFNDLQIFVNNEMFKYLDNNFELAKIKDSLIFYFFLKEPKLTDYKRFHNRYLSKKVFLFDLKDNEEHGIINELNVGNVDKKQFIRHKTATFEINYQVKGRIAKNVYKFFRLQQKNKILPTPMPIFVDEKELTGEVINFYKTDKKKGHKEIIEHLLKDRKDDLQNYYLIYFHNAQKGSRIVDLDFVPVFEYKMNDLPSIKPLFKMTSKKEGELLREYKINNRFEFQEKILNPIFNKQLIQETKNGVWIKYFDDLEVKPEYGATDSIVNMFYKYRKSLYDYIYKSKQQAITGNMFHDILSNSVIDDIRHDEEHNKTYSIKNKLNIWFNLYNYFNNKKKENMASKIQELLEKCRKVANNDGEHLSEDPKEFAFIAGQIIYFLLDKSESANKTHAMLEPFLQKTKVDQLQKAITNTINAYKHAIDFGKGRFERLSKEVLAYDKDINLKDFQPIFLAGYFAEPIIYEKNN